MQRFFVGSKRGSKKLMPFGVEVSVAGFFSGLLNVMGWDQSSAASCTNVRKGPASTCEAGFRLPPKTNANNPVIIGPTFFVVVVVQVIVLHEHLIKRPKALF